MKISGNRSFADRIRLRILLLRLLLVGMLIYMVVVGELGLGSSKIMSPMAETVSRILFFGGMIWVFTRISRNKKLLQNPAKLRNQLLEEQDERNRLLHERSGGIVWDILFVILLFVTLTASLTDMAAFYTAFSLLLCAIAAKLGTLAVLRRIL